MCLVFPKYFKNQIIFLAGNHHSSQGKIRIVSGLDNLCIQDSLHNFLIAAFYKGKVQGSALSIF